MKAIVIREHGDLDKLDWAEVPTPEPGPGEALVRIRAAGANHFDHDIREGVSGITHAMPHVLGIEGVGEVAALGPGVTGPRAGERVAIYATRFCGHCHVCLAGLEGTCMNRSLMGVQIWGCFAEYARCNANQLVALPDSVSFETAAASVICYGTAWHMAVWHGRVQAGQTVLVNAAGSGVGMSAIQIAKLHGATVIASAGSDAKLAKARELGADHVLNYRNQAIGAECLKLTGGRGVDLVIESVGGEVLIQSIEALAFNGSLVTCGAHAGETVPLNVIELFRKHIRLQGSHYASRLEVKRVFDLVAAGALKPVIHGVYPMQDYAKVAALVANRDFFGKMVLVP
ncbi:MAG: zinc-binding dehydrogenase [Alphaproteobacteria bacterium]